MTAVKACLSAAGAHCAGIDLSVDPMYYFILFLAVLTLFALAAWFDPSQARRLARATQLAGHGTGQGAQAGHADGSLAARLLQGERKEDKPCLTPVECVAERRCAGHCGCR